MYLAYRKPPSQSIKRRESNGERPASTQPFIKALRVYKSFADLWQDCTVAENLSGNRRLVGEHPKE